MFSINPTILNGLSAAFLLLSIVSLTNAVPDSGTTSVCTPVTTTVTAPAITVTVTANPAPASPAPASSVKPTVVALPPSPSTSTSIPPPTSGPTTASSATAISSAKAVAGNLTITSKCNYDVWYLVYTNADTSEPWRPFPTGGGVFSFHQYPSFNNTDLAVFYGFSRDSAGAEGISELSMTWSESKSQVIYDLTEVQGNGTSPFLRDGYMAWPMPATTADYPYCNKLQCGANENPCAASYQKGENETYPAGQPYGEKTSICPDSITLNFQLCTG